MTDSIVRPAEPEDLDAVWALVRRAVEKMNAEGSDQWGEDYPLRDDYAADQAAGELIVAAAPDGTILGAACVNPNEDPTYAAIPWSIPGPAMVVHRMAVDPAFQRQGVARALFLRAEELARATGVHSMRVDTYSLNQGMQSLFLSCGFQKKGEINLHERPFPFPCFEKLF